MLAAQLRFPLLNGGSAIIDMADAHLTDFRWSWYQKPGAPPYVLRTDWRRGDKVPRELHRAVLMPPDRVPIDHRNGNTFDNRRANLRVVDPLINARNIEGGRKNSKTGILGVTWHRKSGKWQAVIRHDGKLLYLGIYDEIEDARRARARAERQLWGAEPRRAAELDAYAPL